MLKTKILLVFLIGFGISCGTKSKGHSTSEWHSACIARVIAVDDSIGKIRNRDCQTQPLSQTILKYTKSMEETDLKHCPEAFAKAYRDHTIAWEGMVVVTDKYPTLRGELHTLFEQLSKSQDSTLFKKHLAEIWATWAEVEKYVKK